MKLTVLVLCALLAFPELALAQGFEPEDPAALASFQQAPLDRGIIVRQRVMLEDVPRPGNQSRTSTCVAWAVAYAAGSYFHRARLGGASAALSPAFAYALGNGDVRCLAGSRISRVLDVLRDVGGLPLSEYAYDPGWCGRVPTEAERRRAAAFRIPAWAVVPGRDPVAAKAQISAGRVVIFDMGVGPAFDGHRGKEVFDVLEPEANVFGHAMVAVGFDDTLQAFRIQNSFGTDWGDRGQAWLSYRVWRERAATAYVITDGASSVPATMAAASVPSPPTRQSVVDRLAPKPPTPPGDNLHILLASLMPFVISAAKRAEVSRAYINAVRGKALLVAPESSGSWIVSGQVNGTVAAQIGFERCQLAFGAPCLLFARDDDILSPEPSGEWPRLDVAKIRYKGSFDPAQVPGLSDADRASAAVMTYLNQPEAKAMAIHPGGKVFVASSAGTKATAETRALAACNVDGKHKSEPCLIYAIGNQVVLPERLAQSATSLPATDRTPHSASLPASTSLRVRQRVTAADLARPERAKVQSAVRLPESQASVPQAPAAAPTPPTPTTVQRFSAPLPRLLPIPAEVSVPTTQAVPRAGGEPLAADRSPASTAESDRNWTIRRFTR